MNGNGRGPAPPARSGLVLGGGGSRGLAHIGVLQVLEREGYPIDLITGSSMGGLIAGVYGLLGNARALLDLVNTPADNAPMRFSHAPRAEIYELRRFRRWLRDLFAERTFADLLRPVAMTAVDLDTGEEIVINRGPVAVAIWATTALPGIYTPVQVNGRRLVDGGLLNPVPVDVAHRLGATVTLAVDVLPDADRRVGDLPAAYHRAMLHKVPVALDILSKAFDIAVCAQRDHRLRLAPPDLFIQPDLHGMSAVVYDDPATFIARGVAAAEAKLPEIRRLRDRLLAARAAPVGAGEPV